MKNESNLGLIIFSRMSSQRLPGKALIKINGRELLGRVIDRSRNLFKPDKIVVSTSLEDSDLDIVRFCEREGIQYFRGSEKNVLERAVETAKKFSFDNFLRICGDRPFFSTDISKLAIEQHQNQNCDLTTSLGSFSNIPSGLTTEIIKVTALEKILFNKKIKDKHKEHITSFIYEYNDKFTISYLKIWEEGFLPEMRFVVDNNIDLQIINKLSITMDKSPEKDWIDNLIKAWSIR